jgi:hypothetical protein
MLASVFIRGENERQRCLDQWMGVVIQKTLFIKPLIMIIREYHGRYGYGDAVRLPLTSSF